MKHDFVKLCIHEICSALLWDFLHKSIHGWDVNNISYELLQGIVCRGTLSCPGWPNNDSIHVGVYRKPPRRSCIPSLRLWRQLVRFAMRVNPTLLPPQIVRFSMISNTGSARISSSAFFIDIVNLLKTKGMVILPRQEERRLSRTWWLFRHPKVHGGIFWPYYLGVIIFLFSKQIFFWALTQSQRYWLVQNNITTWTKQLN